MEQQIYRPKSPSTKTNRLDATTEAPCQIIARAQCKVYDDALVESRNFFIFEIVKAQVARKAVRTQTIHYIGDGSFITAGKVVSRKSLFTNVN